MTCRRSPRCSGAAMVILLATVALAACTGGQPSTAVTPASGAGTAAGGPAPAIVVLPLAGMAGANVRPRIALPPIPPAGSGTDTSMPLESTEQLWAQQQDALTAASDQLTQRCMAAAGFSYEAAAHPDDGPATLLVVENLDLGLVDLARARSLGFRPTAGLLKLMTPSKSTKASFAGEQRQHGTAWATALLGAVPGAKASAQRLGCQRTASVLLYGTLTGNPNHDPVTNMSISSVNWARSDPHFVAVQQAWSACMARSGLKYGSSIDLESAGWPQTPTPAEISTAVADVRCKQQTNLEYVYRTVESAYQQALIGQNASSLTQLQADFAVLQPRAQRLLELPASAILRLSQGPVPKLAPAKRG